MISQQGKPAHLVHGTCVLHDPAFCRVATGAIRPQCIGVHIGMAGRTFAFCLLKFERLMAAFAIGQLMLPRQFKLGGIVIERHLCLDHFPAIRTVTGGTVNLEIFTMRFLRKTGYGAQN
jgi:hypothetical protein